MRYSPCNRYATDTVTSPMILLTYSAAVLRPDSDFRAGGGRGWCRIEADYHETSLGGRRGSASVDGRGRFRQAECHVIIQTRSCKTF